MEQWWDPWFTIRHRRRCKRNLIWSKCATDEVLLQLQEVDLACVKEIEADKTAKSDDRGFGMRGRVRP